MKLMFICLNDHKNAIIYSHHTIEWLFVVINNNSVSVFCIENYNKIRINTYNIRMVISDGVHKNMYIYIYI